MPDIRIYRVADEDELPAGPWGVVRLWTQGKPTNLYVCIGDDGALAGGQAPRLRDLTDIGVERDKVFQRAKVALADYGASKRRGFRMDVTVPAAIIAQYGGA